MPLPYLYPIRPRLKVATPAQRYAQLPSFFCLYVLVIFLIAGAEGVCTLKTCDPTITSITLNYTSKCSRLS